MIERRAYIHFKDSMQECQSIGSIKKINPDVLQKKWVQLNKRRSLSIHSGHEAEGAAFQFEPLLEKRAWKLMGGCHLDGGRFRQPRPSPEGWRLLAAMAGMGLSGALRGLKLGQPSRPFRPAKLAGVLLGYFLRAGYVFKTGPVMLNRRCPPLAFGISR